MPSARRVRGTDAASATRTRLRDTNTVQLVRLLRAVVEVTLLEMWKCQKVPLQRDAPNVSHLHCHPIAEVIVAHNQKIAVRQVECVAGAFCMSYRSRRPPKRTPLLTTA